MASGSFQTSTVSTSAGFDHPKYMAAEWEATANEEKNESTIEWVLKAGHCENADNAVVFSNVKLVIDGQVVYEDATQGEHSYVSDEVIASGSLTVAHGEDGTKTVAVSAEAGIYVHAVNSTYSGQIVLDAIAGIVRIDGNAYRAYIDDGTVWQRYSAVVMEGN